MGDHSKKCSNVTVDQIIERMTADLPTPDGQYIQLGFTPPSTPNENHSWPEYQQTHSQISRNVFLPSYTASEPQASFNPMEQNPNFLPQNSNYNYITHPNTMFLPDIQSNIMYDKQINKSMNPLDQSDLISVMGVRNGGYILYNPNENTQQFVQANQDITMCGYIYAADKHEFGLYPSNLQQSQLLKHENINEQNGMYIGDPSVIQHQEMLLQQALNQKQQIINSQQQQQSVQNRTPLIENLVGNWVPNTSGTYSPFGNSQSGAQNLYENTKHDSRTTLPAHGLHQPNLLQNNSNQINSVDSNFADVDLTNFKNCNRNVKKRMVAEVKPMRPSYSDVLAKSAPQQNISKANKIEIKELKNKSQSIKKNAKVDKNLKCTNLSNVRQFTTSNEDIKEVNNERNMSTSPQHKTKVFHTESNFTNENVSEKWSSIENEENEGNIRNNMFEQNEFEEKIMTKKTNPIKHNKVDDCNLSANKNINSADNVKNNGNKKTNSLNMGVESVWKETVSESYDINNRNVDKNASKNSKKAKDTKPSVSYQTRPTERTNLNGGFNEKPCGAGKRSQRSRKRENQMLLGPFRRTLRLHVYRWLKIALKIIIWFLHLLSDVFSLSVQLSKDLGTTLWNTLHSYFCYTCKATIITLMKIKCFAWIINFIDNKIGHFRWAFWNYGKKEKNNRTRNNNNSDGKSWLAAGLEHNITMPSTGEEAMKRLLACKGKDPYSILGVSPDCTDDDIKRYYKKQAFLVHPDKNAQPGAEEAFKILVHAFDIIGEPERRQSYDRKVAESHQVEQAWTELNDLLSQLHQKMEYAANTIRCTNCTKRHRRIQVDRPCYAARLCSQCKIHHAAREGDIWAESSCFGFLWHYYACMDGGVYDITEWAGCQRSNLRHLRPNTHLVQYRIVLGRQTGSNSSSHRHRHFTSRMHDGAGDREPDLEEFLSNLYNQSGANTSGTTPSGVDGNGRTDSTRNRKKNKKKK